MRGSIEFNEEKNILLKKSRGVSFEDVLKYIEKGYLLDNIPHPNKKYRSQRILVVKIKSYAYAVPYVLDEKGNIFLKTVFPSRALTKTYLKKTI